MDSVDPAVERFVDTVRRYCALAEGAAGEPHQDIILVRQLLSELHFAAVNLPRVDLGDEEEQESEPISQEQWKQVYNRFNNLPLNGYWDVFDPLKEEEKEPLYNELADDLADIYRDVKEYLPLYEAGSISEAVWQWRFHFLIHWGQHLTGAQRALHSYFVNKEEEEW